MMLAPGSPLFSAIIENTLQEQKKQLLLYKR